MNTPSPSVSPALTISQNSSLLDEIGMIVNQSGGVAGLAQQFEQKGLGNIMSGWVANGSNPSVNPNQVQEVLGTAPLMSLASKLGLSQQEVSLGVSTLLPLLINELTPAGTVPAHNPNEGNSVLNTLKTRLFSAC